MTRIDAIVMPVGVNGDGEPKRIDAIVMFAGVDADGEPHPLLTNVDGSLVSGPASSSIAHGAVTVGTGATLIVAARSDRKRVFLQGPVAATVYIGISGVAVADGYPLIGDGTNAPAVVLETTAAVYGIVASATQVVRYLEEYGA